MVRTLTVALLLTGCGGSVRHVAHVPPAAAPVDLDAPGTITHEAVVSARWTVPTAGLIDLSDPAAAELANDPHPIVLPVHVLTHPTAGTFIVDTGFPANELPARGLVRSFLSDIEPVEPLADILARVDGELAGVLLTHNHADHVLGLVDVPDGVPVYAGAGEERPVGFSGRVMFPTFARALGDRPLSLFAFDGPQVVDLDGVRAIDLLGDGSLYALEAAGHTPGSTAYLARTADGPVLFTGDCSHTRWGWDHGVTPGTYTHDHGANAESLAKLMALSEAHGMQVEVGHEMR